MAQTTRTGLIAFEDGTVFRGSAFGALATNVGEACFNTSMTGYQEILTDPSYFSQIVSMTAVQIGNYGICPDDVESDGPKVKGFIVREVSPVASNWRVIFLSKTTSRKRVSQASKGWIPAPSPSSVFRGTQLVSQRGDHRGRSDQTAEIWRSIGVDFVKEVTAKESYRWDPEMKQSTPFTVVGTDLDR